MSYQHKLDFGEGPECHAAYEDFLKANNLEDSNTNWTMFLACWEQILQMEAMYEKRGKTIQ
jgi:hypothetical protein